MPENNQNENQNNQENNKSESQGNDSNKDQKDDLSTQIEKAVEEQLKGIKEKLDKAYSERDEANRKLAEREKAEAEAKKKQLEAEGKHKELYEIQLKEERALREAAEKRNVELSRDLVVRQHLAGLPFRNDRALEVAFKEIVSDLVKNDNGDWLSRGGQSLSDFVTAFSKDDSNSFLFKPKANSGSGAGDSGTKPDSSSKKKSLFDLPQEEVIRMAEQGKLNR